jgi:NTP pyrophosphatase (non-canonical NTP hydrolase)
MAQLQQQASDFRKAFELVREWKEDIFELQLRLIREEYNETIVAAFEFRSDLNSDEKKQNLLKELADLAFVCYQMSEYLGWDLDEAMDRVFTSNMSKLDDNGKPIRREDGKVLKGANYQPPDLSDLVANSITES